MHNSNESLYSIQFVSNVTGINPHTIRAWEKRYGATSPVRDRNGRRMYSDQEIQRLEILKKLVSIGNSISDVASMDKNQLEMVLKKYNERTQGASKGKVITSNKAFDWTISLQNMLTAIRARKMDILVHELQKCENGVDPLEFLYRIFMPMLKELSILLNAKAMEKEYFDTVVLALKSKLMRMLIMLNIKATPSKKVLISAGEGSLNELGALAAAVVFSSKKYCVDFVGINSDPQRVISMLPALKPGIVFLALGFSPLDTIPLSEKKDFIEQIIKDDFSSELFVGGFNDVSTYNGLDVEVVNNLEVLCGILEST